MKINIYMEKHGNIHCVYIYIYIISIHSIHILCKQKPLFWMRLIVINRLTTLVKMLSIKDVFALPNN